MSIKVFKGIDFDDIFILPKVSEVFSRTQVNLYESYITRDGKEVNLLPIFVAPMKRISEPEIFPVFMEYGFKPILHRFFSLEQREQAVESLSKLGKPFGISVGSSEEELRFGERLFNTYQIEWVCIDVANGYVLNPKTSIPKKNLIGGNVVTKDGYNHLLKYMDNIRVGIGSGQQCTTRLKTGIGCPQLTAIGYCANLGGNLISDGGIRTAADIIKALIFGANNVMIGSLFGSAAELRNDYICGMASEFLQKEFYQEVKSIEGRKTKIETKVPLRNLIENLLWNLRSSCTYLNLKNLTDKGDFEVIINEK